MKNGRIRSSLLYLLLASVMTLVGAMSADAAGLQAVRSHRPAEVSRLTPLGHLDNAQHLNLAIGLPLRNQAELNVLLSQLSNPSSPNFRHYLTSAQFTERFGPTEKDYQEVIDFVKAQGLNVTATHPNRTILDAEGSVPAIEKAFHITMLSYQHPVEARKFYAPNTEPSVDLSIPILGISGLNNYSLPKPRYKISSYSGKPAVASPTSMTPATGNPSPNTGGTGPSSNFMGKDFRAAYAPGVALTGTGQTVGLLQFDGYTTSDITYYETKAGISPQVPLTNVLLDGFDGTPTGTGGEVEVSLDIEMSMSMAPGLAGIIVYEAGPNGNWYDILNRMANDNLAKQLSCSWYIPNGTADSVADQIFAQMAAQGQTFFSASGDSDAFTGLIPFPGDTPYITEVGGTTLSTVSAGGAYSSETVWNWGGGTGSGGGISTQYAIPTWQQGISMTSNLGSTTMRNVPDVAMTADNVYVRADGVDQTGIGGTSCAAPLWAGFTALVNQQSFANTGTTVGFINPAVYSMGKGVNYTSAFHDTTAGNNFSSSSPAKFPAATGYDLCTGWGSPMGAGMINSLAGSAIPAISTSSPLASGEAGLFYSTTLSSIGGMPAYTYAIFAGNLPTGMGLSSVGVISGTATATGTFSFTVQVTDSKGAFSTTPLSLTIYPQGTPVITTGSPLPAAFVNGNYNVTLTASGGATPYTWTLASGNLPAGLSLSTSGTISGTPTILGTTTFTIQVAGNDGLAWSAPFSITVTTQPTITTASTLASGVVNAPYSQPLAASGGTTLYTWSVVSGSLPTGLKLGVAGVISGTPTMTGTSNFTVKVAGGDGAFSTQSFNLTIAPWGPLDHFAWNAISTPQTVGSPFATTITAQDAVNNTVANFNASAALSAGAPQTILNNPSPPPYSGQISSTYTVGYSFTPSSNIQITAVRSYFGTKVSIWTSGGQLLASVPDTGTSGSWTETPLSSPLQLQAGVTYVVGTLFTGGYYWSESLPTTFPNGTINVGYELSGDGCPTLADGTQWWYVDLKYRLGPSVPVTPTTTGTFASGAWTGNITVAQAGTGVVLNANDGAGHFGSSNAFDVTVGQPPAITNGPAPAGNLAAPYTFTYTFTGLPAPTFSVSAGTLPGGLTLTPAGVLTGTPTVAGLFSGTVKASNGISPDATQNFTLTIFTTFTEWESQFFSVQQMQDVNTSGPNATPQHDGIPNLLKFLFDIDPVVPLGTTDKVALPQVALTTVANVSYLTLTYRQNPTVSGITVNVQSSPDLLTWTTVTPDLSRIVGTDSPTGDPIMQVGVKAVGAKLFIRLHVTSP